MSTSVYDFSAQRIDGSPQNFTDYRDQVLLVVNTASACGYTPQLAGLEALQQRFHARGFNVLAFPCNQFGAQEPGSAEEITSFCTQNYHTSFPLFAKIEVNGTQAHPLYQWLKSEAPGILGTEAIKWNFTKFLLNRQGTIVARYAPQTTPEEIATAIEALLE